MAFTQRLGPALALLLLPATQNGQPRRLQMEATVTKSRSSSLTYIFPVVILLLVLRFIAEDHFGHGAALSFTRSRLPGDNPGSSLKLEMLNRFPREVAIVMCDSRMPWMTTGEADYHHWTHLLNLRYAAMHNYTVVYYRLIGEPTEDIHYGDTTVRHRVEGLRGASWARIPAMMHALEQGELVSDRAECPRWTHTSDHTYSVLADRFGAIFMIHQST